MLKEELQFQTNSRLSRRLKINKLQLILTRSTCTNRSEWNRLCDLCLLVTSLSLSLSSLSHIHTHTHTHARTHAHTHARTNTHQNPKLCHRYCSKLRTTRTQPARVVNHSMTKLRPKQYIVETRERLLTITNKTFNTRASACRTSGDTTPRQ